MRLSFSAVIILVLVVCTSMLFANFSKLITVTLENDTIDDDPQESVSDNNLDHIVIEQSLEHLIWFIQISDLHISVFQDPTRIEHLRSFCMSTVPAISPTVVLATGDLTDAKTGDNVGSKQQIREWQIYNQILYDSRVVNVTTWLDIRGNHDNFNVPDEKSHLNYYRNFMVQGQNERSYMHVVEKGSDKYAFLGIDACLTPGPKRPFNFVGMLTTNETDHILELIRQAKDSRVNYTIAFGHYPTSCIVSRSQTNLRKMILKAPESWVYLCGHFHMLGGLVPNMYTIQQTGLLELELADWKDNRMYRVAAVDNGFFSFVDVRHDVWPVILITNPKHALFMVPKKEPAERLLRSKYIRVLVFSVSPIELVQVKIDEGLWQNATRVADSSLFVVPWIPNYYLTGIHTIHIRARDQMTRERGLSQPFSLDGTSISFDFWPRFVLMSNVNAIFQTMFGFALCLSVIPLCACRVAHNLVITNKIHRPSVRSRLLRQWLRKLWILAAIDRLFYPLVLYPLYLAVGPWVIGEIIDGYMGAVFAWGLLVNHSFLPGSFTYAYGFLHLVSYQFILIVILGFDVDRRYRMCNENFLLPRTRFYYHMPFYLILCLQALAAYTFWLSYGTMAFLLGPLRTWSLVIALILWYQANTISKNCFIEVQKVWDPKPTDN